MRREIAHYVKKLKDEGLSARYTNDVRSTLFSFLDHCKSYGIRNPHVVTAEVVLSYLGRFEPQSASSQRKKACFLRRFLAYAENPVMVNMRVRVRGNARSNVDWLSPLESDQILGAAMTTGEAVMVRGGLLNGLRRCETLRMTVQDAQNAMRSGILMVRGKSGKYRELPLHAGFTAALRAHSEKNPSKVGDDLLLGFARSRSEKILKGFCDRFGKKFSFHTLRRSFGRNAWLNSVSLEVISEFYGHASCDQTRWYLGLNMSDMKRALTQIGCKSELKIIDEAPQRRIAPPRLCGEDKDRAPMPDDSLGLRRDKDLLALADAEFHAV